MKKTKGPAAVVLIALAVDVGFVAVKAAKQILKQGGHKNKDQSS